MLDPPSGREYNVADIILAKGHRRSHTAPTTTLNLTRMRTSAPPWPEAIREGADRRQRRREQKGLFLWRRKEKGLALPFVVLICLWLVVVLGFVRESAAASVRVVLELLYE